MTHIKYDYYPNLRAIYGTISGTRQPCGRGPDRPLCWALAMILIHSTALQYMLKWAAINRQNNIGQFFFTNVFFLPGVSGYVLYIRYNFWPLPFIWTHRFLSFTESPPHRRRCCLCITNPSTTIVSSIFVRKLKKNTSSSLSSLNHPSPVGYISIAVRALFFSS